MNKIHLYFLISILISTKSISQTLIVFIDNGRSVYVGADSRMVYEPIGNYKSVCKIIPLSSKSFYFSVGMHQMIIPDKLSHHSGAN